MISTYRSSNGSEEPTTEVIGEFVSCTLRHRLRTIVDWNTIAVRERADGSPVGSFVLDALVCVVNDGFDFQMRYVDCLVHRHRHGARIVRIPK